MKQIYDKIIQILLSKLNIDYNNFLEIDTSDNNILLTVRYKSNEFINIDINIEVNEDLLLQLYVTNVLFDEINLEEFVSIPLYETDIMFVSDIEEFILDIIKELNSIIENFIPTIQFYLELKDKNNLDLPVLTHLLSHDYRSEWEETEW